MISKKSKSKIKGSEVSEADTEQTPDQSSEITPSAPYKRERVKFDPEVAKFYIPSEVQSKVNVLYNEKKTKLWVIILALIGCAIFTYLAIPLLEQILQMVEDFGKDGTSI